MPEAKLLGLETGVDSKRLLLVVGAVVLGVIIFSRGRGSTRRSSNPSGSAGYGEFVSAVGQAQGDISRLTETQRTLRLQLQQEHANTPAGMRTTLSAGEYRRLPRGVQKQLGQQVNRGGLLIQPSGGSISYTPTETGLQGTRRPAPGPRRVQPWERVFDLGEAYLGGRR